MPTIFQCPVCQLPLIATSKDYFCDNGHRFDRAKAGYVNLLLANQKQSKDPGDSRVMLQSRKAFLDAGYYQHLAETLAQVIADHATSSTQVMLDAGSGEGYYTDFVQQAHDTTLNSYGIDIAKDGVRYAAKRNSSIEFAVASINKLPVQDQSVDFILSVFSPRHPVEMARVLKPDGVLITATPAPTHLQELRQLIYDDVRPYDLLAPDAYMPDFSQQSTQQISTAIQLTSSDDIRNLLQMTPFYWHMPQAKQDHLLALNELDLQIAFEVSIWRCNPAE